MLLDTIFKNFTWEPFPLFENLHRDVDRSFRGAPATRYPPVNVWLGSDAVRVVTVLPGVAKEDIDVTIKDRELTLKAARKAEAAERVTQIRRERPSGEFVRVLELPVDVDAKHVKAEYANGVLTITLPRAAEDRPRKISIS